MKLTKRDKEVIDYALSYLLEMDDDSPDYTTEEIVAAIEHNKNRASMPLLN